MRKAVLGGFMVLSLCASHQGHGDIFDQMRHGFEHLGHDIQNVVNEGVHGVTSTLSPAAREMARKIDTEARKVGRVVKGSVHNVAQNASHVADQAASEVKHVVEGAGEGAKVAGLVGGGLMGLGARRPTQAEIAQMQNEILNALLEPSAAMVKSLYCSDTFMVAQSIRERVDRYLTEFPDSVNQSFEDLINGVTQNGFEDVLKRFFEQAGQGLEVDDNAIRYDVAACAKEWRNDCQNIFPNYSGINLAVMVKILEVNQEHLNQKNRTICQFADLHASK